MLPASASVYAVDQVGPVDHLGLGLELLRADRRRGHLQLLQIGRSVVRICLLSYLVDTDQSAASLEHLGRAPCPNQCFAVDLQLAGRVAE